MKYICLVYLVEKDMSAMTKKEADACVEESLAYDDSLRESGHFVAAHALQPVEGGHHHPRAERQAVGHRRPLRRDQGTVRVPS